MEKVSDWMEQTSHIDLEDVNMEAISMIVQNMKNSLDSAKSVQSPYDLLKEMSHKHSINSSRE
jgi:ABC-type dipeptide/oligopeptide/nickel transport system ATPase component